MTDKNKSVKVALSNVEVKSVDDVATVSVIVTAPTLDRDYDIVDTNTLRIPVKPKGSVMAQNLVGNETLDVPFMINHSGDVLDIIGSAKSASITPEGELKMDFALSSLPKAQAVKTLMTEGHLGNAFSMTFHDYTLEDNMMKNAELLEVSAVWRGSNKDARLLEVSKALELTEKEETTEESEEQETIIEETEVVVEEKQTEENKESEEEVVDEIVEDESEDEKENNKETNNMTEEQKAQAAALVVEKAADAPAAQEKKVLKVNKTEVRKNFIQQLAAVYAGNSDSVRKFAREGATLELGEAESKALDLSGVYLSQVLKDDVKSAFYDAGGVGTLVQREDITGATLLELPVETRGTGFVATALGALKNEDTPVWSTVEVRPYEYSLVVQWKDGAAVQTPIAVYNFVVRYIANQYRALEDEIILAYAGGTVGSETRAATGLVPLLQTAARSSTLTSMAAQYVVPGLATAFGAVQSEGQLTIAANRATWALLATSQDANYNTIFNVVGDKVTVGALGTFNIVTSEALDTETIVVGNFSDYTVATRGGLSTLFSQEATVGSTNLFMQNGSAIRASVDIGGAAAPITSFYLLTTAGYVS